MRKKIIILLTIAFIFLLMPVNAVDSDSNEPVVSDSTRNINNGDSLDILETEIINSNENDSIYISNAELSASEINDFKPITIDKTMSIIGQNATINGNGNPNIFIVAPNNNVTIKNIRFTNTTSFIFINNGNMLIENCTFIDLWESAINNTGNILISNSTFENIKSIYTNKNIDLLKDFYNKSGVIYNTGTLTIQDSRFNNISNPNQITFDNKTTVKKEGAIYTSNNATVLNTNFTNITGRVINNTGKLRIENSKIDHIYCDGVYIQINTTSKEYAIEYNKSPNGAVIYNTDELIFKNNTVKNLVYDLDWRIISKIHSDNGAIYTSKNAIIHDSVFENICVLNENFKNYAPIEKVEQ